MVAKRTRTAIALSSACGMAALVAAGSKQDSLFGGFACVCDAAGGLVAGAIVSPLLMFAFDGRPFFPAYLVVAVPTCAVAVCTSGGSAVAASSYAACVFALTCMIVRMAPGRRRFPGRTQCTTCGYDLRGTGSPCPECGAEPKPEPDPE